MDLREKALNECSSDITTAHHGGKLGRPFWNAQSFQFMYNPCFQFAVAPGCRRYLFTAKDVFGKEHSFEAGSPMSLLTPIWRDIPEGMVELKVEALDDSGKPFTLVGARSFYKTASFPGPEYYPPKARPYKECAKKAYEYAISQSYVRYWLDHDTPDPEYDFNVYPSKTLSALICGMINYAKIEPSVAKEALQIAKNAADFLISISFSEDKPLKHLPPTYYVDFRKDLSKYNNESAIVRGHAMMMIYPAAVGSAYLELEKATGDLRYLEAARRIADFYKDNILPNGSWYLFLSIENGEPLQNNYCIPFDIMKFMNMLYLRTGEEAWKNIEEKGFDYVINHCLKTYNWEGQFEDSHFSEDYSNLSCSPACAMIDYIYNNKAEDKELIKEAEELMRFIEDQFVIWKSFAPWNHAVNPVQGGNIDEWYSPAGLEQYYWAMPIDWSTAHIMRSFLQIYDFTKDPLLLSKADVLGDMLTRMQKESNGFIPTQWMRKSCIEDEKHFWLNCMFETAKCLLYIDEVEEGASK